jgi:hypothetical protein
MERWLSGWVGGAMAVRMGWWSDGCQDGLVERWLSGFGGGGIHREPLSAVVEAEIRPCKQTRCEQTQHHRLVIPPLLSS